MTLRECYEIMESDYDGVAARLCGEKLVRKFVLKFLDDPSYDNLIKSFQTGDYSDAFLAAHTMKGICKNLGFTKLANSSSDLTEALRHGISPEAPALFETVKADYALTVNAIRDFTENEE